MSLIGDFRTVLLDLFAAEEGWLRLFQHHGWYQYHRFLPFLPPLPPHPPQSHHLDHLTHPSQTL